MIGRELGRYLVVEALGEGGMAAVYKGYDRRLNRDVAIKVILRGFEGKPVFLKRFEREAKAVAQLTHPNIVRVIDYGTEGDSPYLVMEYIPGGTLKEKMGVPIPWDQAAQMLAPLARALDYAHGENIIHRDIKPANILVTKSGDLMLSDFGIAKTLGEGDLTQLTGTGVGIGTPAYMAPEQGMGGIIDPRVDIYSLGVVFYEMVTGRPPYQADTPMAVMLKHLNDPLPRPRQFGRNLPDTVEQVLFKALAKDPELRFQTMGDFARSLDGLLRLSEPAEPIPDAQADQATLAVSAPVTANPLPSQAGVPFDHTFQVESPLQAAPADGIRFRKLIWLPVLLGILGVAILAIYAGSHFLPKADKQAAAPGVTAVSTAPAETIPTETHTPLPPTATSIPPTATLVPTPTELPAVWVDPFAIPMVLVPAGEFLMGASEADALRSCESWNPKKSCGAFSFKDEEPVHTVDLETFYIDQYEVTNQAYAACVYAGACEPPFDAGSLSHESNYGNPEYDQHPVVFISLPDAQAYCQWRSARLPSEAEWEKAARGPDGRTYPWGDTLDGSRGNFCDANCDQSWANSAYDDGYAGTAPVGSYPEGASPYGAMDMAGNVSEWVADIYGPYPGGLAETDSDDYGSTYVRRGGSWDSLGSDLRAARRDKDLPVIQVDETHAYLTHNRIGFRCVVPVAP